jgi:pimeloyl-ACP methyl ester carboxylesterase
MSSRPTHARWISPLVLINGWTGGLGILAPRIAPFLKWRCVVAEDLRGHSDSDPSAHRARKTAPRLAARTRSGFLYGQGTDAEAPALVTTVGRSPPD